MAEEFIAQEGDLLVRRYEPSDRQAVRDLCCDTAFLGEKLDPIFQDRDLFADIMTSYYTDEEPESAFVLTKGGKIKGYLLGACRPEYHRLTRKRLRRYAIMLGKFMWRCPHYNRATWKYIRWALTSGRKETPPAPPKTSHFHINILPEARTILISREIFRAFFDHCLANGQPRVHAQIVTFENRRTTAMFRRYGFRVLNRLEVTKYRPYTDQPVFLTTVYQELKPDPRRGPGKAMFGKG